MWLRYIYRSLKNISGSLLEEYMIISSLDLSFHIYKMVKTIMPFYLMSYYQIKQCVWKC